MGHYICPIFMYYINRARVGIPETLRSDICYPVSPIPFSTGFSTSMTKLTPSQFDEVVEQFTEIQVDSMDIDTMVEWITDELIYQYGKLTPDELKERVDCFDEELYDELVDNITTVTYGLKEGESLSFPVHDPTK